MEYQGRVDLRYTHVLSYDLEETDKFHFDNKADKSGLEFACSMINDELTQFLRGKAIDVVGSIDQFLLNFYK